MELKDRIAFIASIESNDLNMNLATNTVKIHRYYEDEAIDCIRSWRKNGGWLKDIPMYCICCTKNKIS